MSKSYQIVSNNQRRRLLELIYVHGMNIKTAASVTKIYYPTAKAINKVFQTEKRVFKKSFKGAQPTFQQDEEA